MVGRQGERSETQELDKMFYTASRLTLPFAPTMQKCMATEGEITKPGAIDLCVVLPFGPSRQKHENASWQKSVSISERSFVGFQSIVTERIDIRTFFVTSCIHNIVVWDDNVNLGNSSLFANWERPAMRSIKLSESANVTNNWTRLNFTGVKFVFLNLKPVTDGLLTIPTHSLCGPYKCSLVPSSKHHCYNSTGAHTSRKYPVGMPATVP